MLRIKELRLAHNLSVRKLAEKVGLADTTILRAEKGERKLSTPQALKLAEFFGVSVDYLLGAEPLTMFNNFIDSLRQTFSVPVTDSAGTICFGLPSSMEPVLRKKLEILFILKDLQQPANLEAIYALCSTLSAKEDFS